MYKYVRYLSVLIFTLFRKVFGLAWFFIAVPFRRYARNRVYNYVLKHDIYLPRLLERPITETDTEYKISPYHDTTGGYIKKRYVSWIEYQLVYWLIWGWLDDDAFCDTTSKVFMYEHLDDRRGQDLVSDKKLLKCLEKCKGNSFDKGDALESNFCPIMTIKWNIRNTAYNFKYKQYEENRKAMLFYKVLFGYGFGYLPTKESEYGAKKGRLVFMYKYEDGK